MHHLHSIPDVCDIEIVSAPTARPTSLPTVLIEVPHGATRRRHFDATRRRLSGEYPDFLEEFFYVNTDVGSIECARWIGRMITNPASYPELESFGGATASSRSATDHHLPAADHVLIVRGLVPRTFIDLNRVVRPATTSSESAGNDANLPPSSQTSRNPSDPHDAHDPHHTKPPRSANHPDHSHHSVTPGLPAYVTHPEDIETLHRMHGDYQALAARAYDLVLDGAAPSPVAASALIVHTYAPRTVAIDRLDVGTLTALRRSYEPEVFATLVRRPDVDLITEAVAGTSPEESEARRLAPESLAALIRKHYAHIGIEATENVTYRLHDATLGYVHSAKYPGRVLCLEINRALLAEPFTPFDEMSIGEANARRMAGPIAAAFLRQTTG